MALVPDQKFSTFQNGGDLQVGDIIVGLRSGLNTKFTYTGELPPGVVVPISQGGTGATTASQARTNLGLGTGDSPQFTNLKLTGANILDVNGLPILNLVSMGASSVNYLQIQNSISGNPILVTPEGSNTDIQLLLMGKNLGIIGLKTLGSTPALVLTTGTTYQHTTNLNFPDTANTLDVTFQDTNGTLAYLSDVAGTVTSAEGTANQVLVNGNSGTQETGDVVFTLPQDISTTSAVEFDSVSFSDNTHGIVGTATDDEADAGYVGEYILTFANGVALTTNVDTDIVSYILDPGDYDVWGWVNYGTGTANIASVQAWINTVSATLSSESFTLINWPNPVGSTAIPVNASRISVAASTTQTIYLSCKCIFGSGTVDATAVLKIRRRR